MKTKIASTLYFATSLKTRFKALELHGTWKTPQVYVQHMLLHFAVPSLHTESIIIALSTHIIDLNVDIRKFLYYLIV